LLSEKEAAAYLSVSLSTIRRWRRIGDGPAPFRFGGILRYRQADLDTFIQVHTTKTK
jgi:excisionase family DNA binding protein